MQDPSNTAEHYCRREAVERVLADAAVSDAIREIHRTMADRFRELALELEIPAAR